MKIALTVCLFGLLATQVSAGEPITFESGDTAVTLLELFTSEGCSSCPPAESWLSRFKQDPALWKRFVPVAFHVDYWDRLGWKDRFAKAEFTARQQRYAAAWRGESVYTPGFVLNGQEWQGWLSGSSLPAPNEKSGNLSVTLTNDNRVTATFVPATSAPRSLNFEVALLGNNLESDINRGENSGRKLHHDFVALQFARTDMNRDEQQWAASLPLPTVSGNDKADAIAAWVTTPADLRPIQATGGWLTASH